MATWLVKFHAVKATKRCLKSHQLFWTKKIPIAGKLYFDDSKREKKDLWCKCKSYVFTHAFTLCKDYLTCKYIYT